MLGKLIDKLKADPRHRLNYLLSFLYSFWRGRIRGRRNNVIRLRNTYYRDLKITIVGSGNVIDFSEGANYLKHSSIYIYGNNNRIVIGERNYFDGVSMYIEDDNSQIRFGSHNRGLGKVHIAAIEGTSVCFGDGCLFSDNVVFRTGDSHSILDATSRLRINPSKSISIGNRVWFGNSSIILKGVTIADDSIVGTGAVVTKDVPEKVIVAGNPARIVKEGTCWELQR